MAESRRLIEERKCDSDNAGVQDTATDPNEQAQESRTTTDYEDSVKDAQEDKTKQTKQAPAARSDSAEGAPQRDFLQAWKESSQERPLRVLVCGLGGVGKTTLINHLLQLEGDEERGKEGRNEETTTTAVMKYESTTTKSGVKVCIFDTPGFNNADLSDETIIAMMEDKTQKKLDMLFYCIALNGPTRVQQGDVRAMRTLTQVFTQNIWKSAVIVLTFANVFEERVKSGEEYRATIAQVTTKVGEVLRNDCRVNEEIAAEVPVITAGYTQPLLKYEAEECKDGWDNRLFLKAIKQVDPALFPALFAARWNWKDAVAALGGGGGGAAVGGGMGAGIGVVIGVPFGGPVGAAVGAVVGGGIGAGVGGAGGAGAGLLAFQMVKIKSVLKVKFEKWKMKRRSTSREATH